ncbi:MAG: DUF1801 domain-containing protein [Flavobacterium sp.]|nr:MAG: DUF1801 domain-containing protein [Flavobacterium sp.]
MNPETISYNNALEGEEKSICDNLASVIDMTLQEAENKIWHRHPVWFLDGNPVVGYSKQKAGIRLMFWSGASFNEPDLLPGTGKFKDASIIYSSLNQVNTEKLARWLEKSREIQWDYKNIYKRKGVLERLV